MSLEAVRKCDAFGVFKGVERYRVQVLEKTYAPGSSEFVLSSVCSNDVDLSPRGLARLKKCIRHGLTPPGVNSTQTEHEGATHEAERQGRD